MNEFYETDWFKKSCPYSTRQFVAWRGRSERAFRAVEGVRRSVFGWLLWPWMSFTVTSYNARYIHSMYIYLHRHHTHTPLMLTVRIPSATPHFRAARKLHTLMRKCLLPQHPHNSTLRPASPRPLRRVIPRQSLACPGDATSNFLDLSIRNAKFIEFESL